MAIIKKTSPASLRVDNRVDTSDVRGVAFPDRRPYLVAPIPRKVGSPVRQQLALFPHEAEDARLTGATRSLYRRLLALNLPRAESSRMEATSQLPREITERRKALTGVRIA
jgi:hypothetical protein